MTQTMTYLLHNMCLLPDMTMMARQVLLFYSQKSNQLHEQPRTSFGNDSQMGLLLGTVLCCSRKSAGKAIYASYVAML